MVERKPKKLPKSGVTRGQILSPLMGRYTSMKCFFWTFLQKLKPYGAKACNTRFLKIVFDSAEICSTYAQHAMKFVPRMLSVR
jgi:hypothetical protein